jgi:hypothetical protein
MKNLILASVLVFLGFAAKAQGPGEQRAIARAEAAARDCMRDAGYPANLEIHSSAQVSTICDYFNPNPQYFGYRVTVWGTNPCPPNMYCIQIVYPIATVEISCTGDVSNVQCDISGI